MAEEPGQPAPQVDPQLVEYVARYLGKFSDEQIRGRLLQDGIPPLAVDLAFQTARCQKAVPPPPPPPPGRTLKRVLPILGTVLVIGGCIAVNAVIRKVRSPEFERFLASLQGGGIQRKSGADPERQELAAKAEDAFRKASAFQTYASLALRNHQLGQHAEAVNNATAALEAWDPATMSPDNKKAMLGLRAQAHEKLGQENEALADYSAIGDLSPKEPDAILHRCQVFMNRRDFPAVEMEAQRLIDNLPERPEGWSIKAGALANMGRTDEAEKAYTEAIIRWEKAEKKEPEQLANLYFNRGVIRANAQRKREAIDDIDRAVRLNPEQQYYYEVRARLRTALGDIQGAQADSERALTMGPGAMPDSGLGELNLGPTLPQGPIR